MEVFLSEHGQTIQYAVIGVIIVALISIITNTSIKKIMPAYNCEGSNTNREFSEEYKKKCPIIVGDDVIYVTYLDKSFDVTNQISARDYDGKDITDKLKTYGDVDVFHRGVYNIKCIVRGESGIKSIRNMNVVVE